VTGARLVKHKSLLAVFSLVFVLTSPVAYGQNMLGSIPKKARTAADYQPRTLQDVVRTGASRRTRCRGENTLILSGDLLPSRVRVTYIGSLQPIPKDKQQILREWAQQYAGVPEGYTHPYQTEILFQEGKRRYWVAVKQKDIPRLQKEIRSGEGLDLNLIRVGGMRDASWEGVLLVESFQKLQKF
jgi:hypothetical protein